LTATNVTFATPVYIDSTASGALSNCKFQESLFVGTPGSGGISITGTSFSETPTFDTPASSGLTLTTDTFAQGVQIQPGSVPLIDTDTFATNSTIQVLGNRDVVTNTEWKVLPNVSQYEIVYDNGTGVHVQRGATLTWTAASPSPPTAPTTTMASTSPTILPARNSSPQP